MARSLRALQTECGPGATDSRTAAKTVTESELEFKLVGNDDIALLSDFFKIYPSRSCDYSLAGILMWADYFGYQYAITDDTLFIKGTDPLSGQQVYYSPLGAMDRARAMRMMLSDISANARKAILVSPVESSYDVYKEEFASDPQYRDAWKEYLYDIEQFTGFKGKKMEKKRNHLNYFEKHYPGFTVQTITPADRSEIEDFTHRFESGHKDSRLFAYESAKTLETIRDYDRYPYDGILIRLDGKVIGYTFGEKSGDTFFVHVEKGDYAYNGIYQALASYLARRVAGKYPDVKYLNREEDMGDDALRKSKDSYHPSLIVNKKISIISIL